MTLDMTELLKKEITKQETELAAKKLLLKTLNRKPRRGFYETKLGIRFSTLVAKATKKFLEVHVNAAHRARDPQGYYHTKMLEKVAKLLVKAEYFVDNPPPLIKSTHRLACKCAEMEMKLSVIQKTALICYPSLAPRIEEYQARLKKCVAALRRSPVASIDVPVMHVHV